MIPPSVILRFELIKRCDERVFGVRPREYRREQLGVRVPVVNPAPHVGKDLLQESDASLSDTTATFCQVALSTRRITVRFRICHEDEDPAAMA
jgi:hypothetical protein